VTKATTATKFTPGPWELQTLNRRLPVVREIKMPHGEASTYCTTIRSVTGEHVCKLDFGYERKGLDEANARLISAAPEMYEFIARVADSVSRAEFTDAVLDSLIEDAGDLLRRIDGE
jgi:hypothetical protein